MALSSCAGLDRSGLAVWWGQSLIWTLGMTPNRCPSLEVTPYASAGVPLFVFSLALRDTRLSCPFPDWGPSVKEELSAHMSVFRRLSEPP